MYFLQISVHLKSPHTDKPHMVNLTQIKFSRHSGRPYCNKRKLLTWKQTPLRYPLKKINKIKKNKVESQKSPKRNRASRDHHSMAAHVHDAVLQPVILGCVLSDSQHHFKPISTARSCLRGDANDFHHRSFLSSLPPPPPTPAKSQLSRKPQTPFFFRSLWRRRCFDSIVHFPFCESMEALPKKVIYGQKETLNLTLIRSLHYSAGF